MDSNIIDVIQTQLGYRPLQKIDPNMQETKDAYKSSPEEKLPQAAIPAVLAGIIKYSDSPEGVTLLSENKDWLKTIYGEKEKEASKRVADYAGVTSDEATQHMTRIANEAVTHIRGIVKTQDPEKLRSYMNGQRHSVLSHLPAAMKIGDLVNEETFDDRTNKMEGPVSGFLHRIENII